MTADQLTIKMQNRELWPLNLSMASQSYSKTTLRWW